jgi:hypothetical protein
LGESAGQPIPRLAQVNGVLATSRTTSLLHGAATPGSIPAARVSGFHVAFVAAAAIVGLAWTVAVLQLRSDRKAKPVNVSRDLAARAIGCARCAPVALAGTGTHSTSTPASDPIAARHR